MFKIKYIKIVAQDKNKYLSFPDIIADKDDKNTFYLTYREADRHHPSISKLIVKKSTNQGNNWKKIYEHGLNMYSDKWVWNCPRLSYLPDGKLYIFCDMKNNLSEKRAEFQILKIDIKEGISTWVMTGMVPDHIIKYNGDLFCANHKLSDDKNSIYQLVNRSKDQGNTWDDRNILARDPNHDFCEASVINHQNKHLIAYLRDNRVKFGTCNNPIQKYISVDGYSWKYKQTLPINGHRVTAIIDKNKVFASFRNTENHSLSVFSEILDDQGGSKVIDVKDIEEEKVENMYHFGYSGLVKCNEDSFLLTYYIQQEKPNPVIKVCKFTWRI